MAGHYAPRFRFLYLGSFRTGTFPCLSNKDFSCRIFVCVHPYAVTLCTASLFPWKHFLLSQQNKRTTITGYRHTGSVSHKPHVRGGRVLLLRAVFSGSGPRRTRKTEGAVTPAGAGGPCRSRLKSAARHIRRKAFLQNKNKRSQKTNVERMLIYGEFYAIIKKKSSYYTK